MTKCGFVAILGLPNAGKSTLVNTMAGGKVSIVSPKAQTTRHRILGVLTAGDSQLILMDTPGIFKPRRKFDQSMVHAAWQAAGEADIRVVLVDVTARDLTAVKELIQGCGTSILVLNKIDQVEPTRLLGLTQELSASAKIQAVFMISALKNDGVNDLKDYLFKQLPQGPWLFEASALTDQPQHLWAAEITREQLYFQLQQELPYDTWVETESWENFADGSICIHQIVYVNRQGQKRILVGAKGERIKSICLRARQEIATQLGTPVHLFLRVKIQENWAEKPNVYRALGLTPLSLGVALIPQPS